MATPFLPPTPPPTPSPPPPTILLLCPLPSLPVLLRMSLSRNILWKNHQWLEWLMLLSKPSPDRKETWQKWSATRSPPSPPSAAPLSLHAISFVMYQMQTSKYFLHICCVEGVGWEGVCWRDWWGRECSACDWDALARIQSWGWINTENICLGRLAHTKMFVFLDPESLPLLTLSHPPPPSLSVSLFSSFRLLSSRFSSLPSWVCGVRGPC